MLIAPIKINSPTSLADGDEYLVAFSVDVEYFPILRGDTAEDVKILGYTNIAAALTIAGIDIQLTTDDEQRLFDSWLAYAPRPASKLVSQSNLSWLKEQLCESWNNGGRERFQRDQEFAKADR